MVESSTLMEFYQLKTLNPRSYENDTIHSDIKVDPSTNDFGKLSKETVNHLLSDTLKPKIAKRNPHHSLASAGNSNHPDPLGFETDLLDCLMDRDIIDDSRDPQLENYKVNSKSFNPTMFLSVIHKDKTIKDLKNGIRNLELEIESKKPLLQELITDNFEKTLSSKNSLDKVFTDFTRSNLNEEISILDKNLASSNSSANKLLGPVNVINSRENELKNALQFIEQNKMILDLPKKLKKYIDDDDADSVLLEYNRGSAALATMKLSKNKNPIFNKICFEVDNVIQNYINLMVEDLKKVRIELISDNYKSHSSSKHSNFVILIKRIIELKNDDSNPMKNFIDYQYNYIMEDLDKGLAKIDYEKLFSARASISNACNSLDLKTNNHFRDATFRRIFSLFCSPNFSEEHLDQIHEKLDHPLIIQLWTMLTSYINDVTNEVITKKILKFEDIIEFFISDFKEILSSKAKSKFEKMKINNNDLKEMKTYFVSLISKICSRLDFFFSCTSEDLTNALKLSAAEGPRAKFAPVSERSIDDPASFGFIAPNSNSISTLCYCAEVHHIMTTKLLELQDRSLLLHSTNLSSVVDSTLKSINKNIIMGCLAVLKSDIKKVFYVDTMTPSDEIDGATKLVTFISNYYKFSISKMSELYRFKDDELLPIIETEFLHSFNVLLEGMIDNVAKQCELDPSRSDYHYMATIYNMRELENKLIPSLIKMFDIKFQTTLTNRSKKDMEVYKLINEYENALFAEYMQEHITVINLLVTEGVTNYNSISDGLLSKLPRKEIVEISPYILKTINHINTLRLRLSNLKVRRSFIFSVQQNLMNNLQKKLVRKLSSSFTSDADYQIVLDLLVLISLYNQCNAYVFKTDPLSTKDFEMAYQTFKSRVADIESVESNYKANLVHNKTQFTCFYL